MAKQRKRDSQPINAELLRNVIRDHFCCSTSQFAKKAKVSRSTIYNALRGKPLDKWVIARICQKVDQIDLEQLTAINLPLSIPEPAKQADGGTVRPSILTLVSIRGGVGKTLVAVSIAVELASKFRVALVDIDLFTFGATRWFNPVLQSAVSPLTFLDFALGSQSFDVEKQVFSCEIEPPIAPDDKGELFYIPSHAPVSNASQGLKARPILVDWSLDDAQDAIDSLIERLSELRVDVIILDTHPGLMALTDVVCNEADCNILVSDCDSSTLQANWLLAWEIQSRQQRLNAKARSKHMSRTPAWRFALNRIPSPRTVADCQKLVITAGELAQLSWPTKESAKKVSSEESDPVFLLPELEAMRLDELESYAPTSIKRRGGNRTALATKHLVCRLASEGILSQAEAAFPYANEDNQIAREKLRTYLENYDNPWYPGLRSFDTRTIFTLLTIFVLFLIFYITFVKVLSKEQEQPELLLVLKIVASLIVCLVFSLIAGLIKEVIRECRSICWYIDACAINNYPAELQSSLYDAGVYRSLTYDTRLFSHFLLLIALIPAIGFAGITYNLLGPLWRYLMLGAMALILLVGIWSAEGNACVIRVVRLWFSVQLQRFFHRQILTDAEDSRKNKGSVRQDAHICFWG
ncbi:ParA family protein [Bythopirellula polymerisocia]|uniref:CobQ/CobB/MinD/ParA nucleotide binding domain protein n=1 Tax=Bythopirellula polymerisocia TaxID=2528003 RepID=A0A5C6CB63_9BACT|nr:ParA family protein [Bythopirellula polymerisocia]TWU21322.1 CobQ/CobB/MinD/ParA nucleotide binding domain protein [Bythopirellula polymerisocia]